METRLETKIVFIVTSLVTWLLSVVKRRGNKQPANMTEPRNTHLDHHKSGEEFGSKVKDGKNACTSSTSNSKGKVHYLCDESGHDIDDNTTEYSIYYVNEDHRKREPYRVTLSLNGEDISMELDTRANKTVMITIIREIAYNNLHERDSSINLKYSNSQLRTYTGEGIPILGTISLTVEYKKRNFT